MREGLTYDDVLIVPNRTDVDSRSDVDLSTNVTPSVEVEIPLISAPMDSVTETELAQALSDVGGVGIIHRVCSRHEQEAMVSDVDGTVGASVGVGAGELDRAGQCVDAGADFICVDVAHAHMEKAIDKVERYSEAFDVDIMAGNVATYRGAKDLMMAGADSVKVGVGPGSLCSTRIKTGVGVPQFTAVRNVSEKTGYPPLDSNVIADGGIRSPGDAVKALIVGADAVMIGGLFGRCEESPGGSESWGMASERGKEKQNVDGYIEGVEAFEESVGTVEDLASEFRDGIQSGFSYCGGHTIEEARDGTEFIEVSESTKYRNDGFAGNTKHF